MARSLVKTGGPVRGGRLWHPIQRKSGSVKAADIVRRRRVTGERKLYIDGCTAVCVKHGGGQGPLCYAYYQFGTALY